MILRSILNTKGRDVHTIGPDATLDDLVQDLVRYNIGSLVVCEGAESDQQRMLGIITERDVLRAQAANRASLDQLRVRDLMTTELITASPEDRLEHAMSLMTEHHIRHLPVLVEGRLFGIISIGDVVKRLYDQLQQDNSHMQSFIRGDYGVNARPR